MELWATAGLREENSFRVFGTPITVAFKLKKFQVKIIRHYTIFVKKGKEMEKKEIAFVWIWGDPYLLEQGIHNETTSIKWAAIVKYIATWYIAYLRHLLT